MNSGEVGCTCTFWTCIYGSTSDLKQGRSCTMPNSTCPPLFPFCPVVPPYLKNTKTPTKWMIGVPDGYCQLYDAYSGVIGLLYYRHHASRQMKKVSRISWNP